MEETALKLATPAIIALLGWLWAKARGKKAARIDEILSDATEGIVHQFAANGVKMEDAQKLFETIITSWVSDKLGLNAKSDSAQWLVHEFVAYGMRKLAEEYRERTQPLTIERLLRTIAASSNAAVTKFDAPPAEKRTVPAIQADIVEIKP